MNQNHADPPLAILAELTHRCPLRCPYCSNPTALVGRSGELSTAEWADVFRQAADMGALQVHMSGGEPAARKDLEKLCQAAVDAGLYINLITSGLMIDGARLDRLAAIGVPHVQLSVQGSDAAMCDAVGGYDGAFAIKQDFARAVVARGISLTLNAVLHRANCHQAGDMITMARDLGAARIEVAHTQYYGWGLLNRDGLLPSRDQLDDVTRIVEQARKDSGADLQIDYVVPDYYAETPKACMAGWGRRFLTISPEGKVLPCHAAETVDHLTFDTVRDKTLSEIWYDSPAFNTYRGTDWMPEPCQSCDLKEVDWGGCRCQALALVGDAGATDPVCSKSGQREKLLDALTDAAVSPKAGPDIWTYRQF
ncbi:MAG: pyrroloquinoline quinone biosynthesis protein PqqE [Alphaproteobacteria bacterium]